MRYQIVEVDSHELKEALVLKNANVLQGSAIDQIRIDSVNQCPLCASPRRSFYLQKKSTEIKAQVTLYKCNKCNFVYSDSVLDNTSLEVFYNFKHSSSNYSNYRYFDELKKAKFKFEFEHIEKIIGFKPSLLDLGCGEGESLEVAKQLGWEAVGIEVAPDAIGKAERNGIKNIIRSSIEDFKVLHLKKFDAITLFDSLDHVKDPKKVMNDVFEQLKPNGIVYLDVCNIDSWYRRIMGKYFSLIIPLEHLSYFSPSTLNEFLVRTGFTEIQIKDCPRVVSIKYLKMSLQTLNPLLGKIFNYLCFFIPRRILEKQFKMPVGIISATAYKPKT